MTQKMQSIQHFAFNWTDRIVCKISLMIFFLGEVQAMAHSDFFFTFSWVQQMRTFAGPFLFTSIQTDGCLDKFHF